MALVMKNLFNIITEKNHVRSIIGVRIILIIFIFSFIVTISSTAAHIYVDYKREKSAIENRISQIGEMYSESIAVSLWNINENLLRSQIDGIMRMPDMQSVILVEEKTGIAHPILMISGIPIGGEFQYTFPLIYNDHGNRQEIGALHVEASLDRVYDQIKYTITSTLKTEAFKIFFISIIIMYLVQVKITNHLVRISKFLQSFDINFPAGRLFLKRKQRNPPDELDQLTDTVNCMIEGLCRNYEALSSAHAAMVRDCAARQSAEQEVTRLNMQLENEVRLRTAELNTARECAEGALAELRRTQADLIQAEKMASLGALVGGVAHEINTPVGVALTSVTYLADQTRAVALDIESRAVKRSELIGYLAATQEACSLIESNLLRAARLIESFKLTAVDQVNEERRKFNLQEYITEVFHSLGPLIDKHGHQVIISCDPHLEIDSYPGLLFQVLMNFTTNALTHAYGTGQAGTLRVAAQADGDGCATLIFTDDGCGVAAKHIGRIFDPFFTTRRGTGGSGLGLHIVYNIVTRKLNGGIHVDSAVGRGTTFILRFPIVAPDLPIAGQEGS